MLQQSLATVMGPAAKPGPGATDQPSAPALKPVPSVAAAPPPAAAPASVAVGAPAQPSDQEAELIGRAQSTGAAQDYQAYLEAYPTGVFAALAAAEIRRALVRRRADPTPPAGRPHPEQQITFLTPLTRTGPIQGRSIAQIIEGSPQYPPIEGLPDSVWKGKTCSNCHHWTQPALCEQGKTYLSQTGEFALGNTTRRRFQAGPSGLGVRGLRLNDGRRSTDAGGDTGPSKHRTGQAGS